jgi:ubiquinone/menaquinone biosynthesis C-methylase UbiE
VGSNAFTGPRADGRTWEPFDKHAAGYDAWYETTVGEAVFEMEVGCLRPQTDRLSPRLEVGVGTGRFARALGIEFGVDPSRPMLELARRRGVRTVQGLGEHLPFRSSSIGGVLVAFTICFVRDPVLVLEEISRVLIPGGGLVLGFLPRGTAWAEMYARRGAEHHPIYETARFYTAKEVEDFIVRAGLRITGYRSTLLQPPGLDTYASEEPTEEYQPEASFLTFAAST